jgi:hypothetical protein
MSKTNAAIIIVAIIVLIAVIYLFLDTVLDILSSYGVI